MKITVLISGNGSNLQSLIDHCENGFVRAQVNHVISNKKEAFGLQRAQNAGIPASYLPFRSKKESRGVYEMELLELILTQKPDLIVCAGWMHIFGIEFLENLQSLKIPIINLHPALPGEFPGVDGIGDAYRSFMAKCQGDDQVENGRTGCMVHYVIPEIDAGKVIQTFPVPIYRDDSLDDLKYRVQLAEKPCLLMAITKIILKSNNLLH